MPGSSSPKVRVPQVTSSFAPYRSEQTRRLAEAARQAGREARARAMEISGKVVEVTRNGMLIEVTAEGNVTVLGAVAPSIRVRPGTVFVKKKSVRPKV